MPFSGPVTFDDVQARVEAVDLGDTPEAMRHAFARLVLGEAPGPQPGREETVGGVPCRVVGGGDVRAVWFHGGGYVFGSSRTHARVAEAFAQRIGAAVAVPDVRLAPEHVWPAQRDDALAVARALGRVALVGDSAGGHLALVSALALAADGTPPVALALFSPNTDRTGLSDTRGPNTPRDPMNADDDDRELAAMTFPNHADDDPEVSPALADLSALPRTHVEVGAREVLLGDGRVLAARAEAAGAPVSLHVEPGAFHMWQLWTPWLPEADASLDRAAAAVRGALSG